MGTIDNPRIRNFKEKTLLFRFNIEHCPGKWHRGADALSRYPSAAINHIFHCNEAPDELEADDIESEVQHMAMGTLASIQTVANAQNDLDSVISLDRLKNVCSAENEYKLLRDAVVEGFPDSRSSTTPELRPYWEMGQQSRLSTLGPIVLMDRRLVIPKLLRKSILHCLHSAHQGCSGMKARANQTVYWPGINNSIKNFRMSCNTCTHCP